MFNNSQISFCWSTLSLLLLLSGCNAASPATSSGIKTGPTLKEVHEILRERKGPDPVEIDEAKAIMLYVKGTEKRQGYIAGIQLARSATLDTYEKNLLPLEKEIDLAKIIVFCQIRDAGWSRSIEQIGKDAIQNDNLLNVERSQLSSDEYETAVAYIISQVQSYRYFMVGEDAAKSCADMKNMPFVQRLDQVRAGVLRFQDFPINPHS